MCATAINETSVFRQTIDRQIVAGDRVRFIPPGTVRPDSSEAGDCVEWLARRGFPLEELPATVNHYGLLYDQRSGSLIFPHRAGGVISACSYRFIRAKIRNERWRCLPDLKNAWLGLYDQDCILEGGRYLFVVEGLTDVLWWYAACRDLWKEGFRVTCVFHRDCSPTQLCLLRGLRKRYDRIYIAFDPIAWMSCRMVARRLSCSALQLDGLYEDWAAMNPLDIHHVVETVAGQSDPVILQPVRGQKTRV